MVYTIKRNKIIYYCDACGQEMESPKSDAGKTDSCPKCDVEFVVPGAEEVAEEREAENQRAQQAAADESSRSAERERMRQRAHERDQVTAAKVPAYSGLSAAGSVICALAYVTIGVGTLGLLFGVVKSVQGGTDTLAPVQMAAGGGLILIGVFYLAAGQALHALRDIARNSWAWHHRRE